MKINGVEISEVDNAVLAKQLGFWRIIRWFYLIICVLMCTVVAFSGAPVLYVIPIGLIVTVMVMLIISRPIRNLRKELSRRQQSEEDSKNNKNAEKKAAKKMTIFLVVVCLLAGLVGVYVWRGISSGGSSGGGDRCRNCGRETGLVVGFNYCYDCYDGFVDWQKRTSD